MKDARHSARSGGLACKPGRPADDRPHRLSIAPMMERTDRHFRYLLRILAPEAWLYTEMITARALTHGDPERFLRFDEAEHPLAIQLGGGEPDELARAARLAEDAGYDEINLNVGCPSDRVQAGCFGAALMLEPRRVADCVGTIAAAVKLPVTVKTRIGVDDQDDYEHLNRFTAEVVAAGCRTLIVHARKAWLRGLSPKQNREIPPLDYPRVHRLKRDWPALEIVINGGIRTAPQIRNQLATVDGVMLGRVAYEDTMQLRDAARVLNPNLPAITQDEVLTAFEPYLARALAAGTPLPRLTRHLLGLYCGVPGSRDWRRRLSSIAADASGLDELYRLIAKMNARMSRTDCAKQRTLA
jgi:tRNA-dihydrouridine synthase A